MSQATVNVSALYQALESKRQRMDISWRSVAQHLDIAPSTFTRMAQGRRPDVDTLASLLRWLDLPLENFVTPPRTSAESANADPLAQVGVFLRMNKNLSEEAATALERLIVAISSSPDRGAV